MNIDEIKVKAEMLLKNSRETQGEFVEVYNNGFEDGVNFVIKNLQQCNVISSVCNHRFVRTTKNYKPAKKCVECGCVVQTDL